MHDVWDRAHARCRSDCGRLLLDEVNVWWVLWDVLSPGVEFFPLFLRCGAPSFFNPFFCLT